MLIQPDPILPRLLRSSAWELDPSCQRLGWLRASDLRDGVAALRERYQEDGYVWIRNALPRDDVLAFRRVALRELLCSSSKTTDGLDDRVCQTALMALVRSKAYAAFCSHPRLQDLFTQFLREPFHLHQRKIIRLIRPWCVHATGAHYDRIYLRGGTDQFVTAWIPIGDIPVRMGGVVYLEHSQAWGQEAEQQFRFRSAALSAAERVRPVFQHSNDGGWITSNLCELAERLQSRWLVANYAAGDVVLHSPYIIHASTNNDDPAGRIRLSTDLRFQSTAAAMDQRWTQEWTFDDEL